MKFIVSMKTPDALYDGVQCALKQEPYDNMPDEELDQVKDKALECAKKWFKWGEYLYLEIDDDKGTIRVLEL